jgi:hypothetical protein
MSLMLISGARPAGGAGSSSACTSTTPKTTAGGSVAFAALLTTLADPVAPCADRPGAPAVLVTEAPATELEAAEIPSTEVPVTDLPMIDLPMTETLPSVQLSVPETAIPVSESASRSATVTGSLPVHVAVSVESALPDDVLSEAAPIEAAPILMLSRETAAPAAPPKASEATAVESALAAAAIESGPVAPLVAAAPRSALFPTADIADSVVPVITADMRGPDTREADTREADTVMPDTLMPDTLMPDTLMPDTLMPDTLMSAPTAPVAMGPAAADTTTPAPSGLTPVVSAPAVAPMANVTPLAAPEQSTVSMPTAATPLASQLAKPIFSLVGAAAGEHVMTITVSPDNLGPVTVRAHVGADGIRVEMFSPSDAAREALRLILPDLRRDLSGAGQGGSGLAAQLELSSESQPNDSHGTRQRPPPAEQSGTQPSNGEADPPRLPPNPWQIAASSPRTNSASTIDVMV